MGQIAQLSHACAPCRVCMLLAFKQRRLVLKAIAATSHATESIAAAARSPSSSPWLHGAGIRIIRGGRVPSDSASRLTLTSTVATVCAIH
jgi:hypothetical protein